MLSTPGEGRSESPAKLGYGTQMLTTGCRGALREDDRGGRTIWEEPHETIYGEKQYSGTDLEGHRWLFSQHVRRRRP